ncbi:hypothetical protein DFH06DRAFT_1286152 [Mycena polygramma]|nr:hypothetical protein DFH06DRAFT_1286152 [Mycena polygramma]
MTATIGKGSLVLVTGRPPVVTGGLGANSFIGSHVVDQLLAAGYNVRGTSRSVDKSKWLEELFDEKYGRGRFEAVSVPDMIQDGAFDKSVKGVSGIVHLATVATFSDKVDEVVPPTVKGALEVLKSASTEPGIKSVRSRGKGLLTEGSWNESAMDEARNNPQAHPFTVYAASKAEAERAIWQTVEQTKPPFHVATILPDANLGPILKAGTEKSSGTASWIGRVIQGDKSVLAYPPQWFVNVADTARLHVAALIDPACNGKRIFAYAEPFNWNDILGVLRKQNPGREFLEDVPRSRAEFLRDSEPEG